MDSKFVFQTLPYHIIKHICRYVVMTSGSSCSALGDVVQTANDRVSSLLVASRAWRYVALSIKHFRCNISLSEKNFLKFYFDTIEAQYADLPYFDYYGNFIKRIELCFEYHHFIDGTIIHTLETADIDQPYFPNARTLTIEISFRVDTNVGFADAISNAEIITDYFRDMLPLIDKVTIYFIDKTSALFQPKTDMLKPFLDYLGTLACVELYINDFDVPNTNLVSHFNSISHLECRWDKNYMITSHIIQTYSHLLVGLCICYHTFTDFKRLLIADNNNHIIYSNMNFLLLTRSCNETMDNPLSIPQIVPFPRLKDMKLMMQYPFGDDLPFRGNSTIMERAFVDSGITTLQLLTRYGIISDKRRGKLEYFCLGDRANPRKYSAIECNIIKVFFHKALTCMELLFVTNLDAEKILVDFLSTNQFCFNLTNLSLVRGSITLEECIEVLLKLPLLSFLCCHISSFGSKFANATTTKEVNALRSQYTSQKTNLKMISFFRANTIPDGVIVSSILTLASIFLNLNSILPIGMHTNDTENLLFGLAVADVYADIRDQIIPQLKFRSHLYSYESLFISIYRCIEDNQKFLSD